MTYNQLATSCHTAGNEKKFELLMDNLELVKYALDNKSPQEVGRDLNTALGELKLMIKVLCYLKEATHAKSNL